MLEPNEIKNALLQELERFQNRRFTFDPTEPSILKEKISEDALGNLYSILFEKKI